MEAGTIIVRTGGAEANSDAPAWYRFRQPLETLAARTPGEVAPLLERVARATEAGQWAAGFLAYEAAAGLDPHCRVTPPRDELPLAWFGLYAAAEPLRELPPARGSFGLTPWRPELGPADYARRVARIRELIAAGDTYQVNFTFPLRARFEGDPWALLMALDPAQRGRHGAFVLTDRHAIVSASPELFFAQEGDTVLTRPMKGTARRGRWGEEDERQAAALAASAKDRAENVMIVDLLRNDLGRLARTGTVEAGDLFRIERYATVWQMTSAIRARTGAHPAETLRALFPCGSITGAPKLRTMEIIAELESAPRGIYTGAIGWIGPRRRACFNVAIRTVQIDRADGEALFGVGSGVTWSSVAADEYAECLAKARLLETRHVPFELLESLLREPGAGYFLLERHLARMVASARYFGFAFDPAAARAALERIAATLGAAPHKVRLLADAQGAVRAEAGPLGPLGPARVGLAAGPVDSRDVFLYHKTTRRDVYDRARAERPGLDDVLLWNERGELTESTVANVVVAFADGRRWTPARECGLLAGTLREELIARGELAERVIYKKELARARGLWLINSVRRWRPATLIPLD